ncbi:tetratricopeptide repeat protein [Clostridium sp.]|uniref:tetratricopeptide repeat protein n=1 Tax=Clostridium sp. TaxID=1506 RepID=UPI003F3AA216
MSFINSENLSALECIKTFDLANSYYYGIGVEKNIEVAHDLYLKSSKFGLSEAQNMLGIIYSNSSSNFYDLNKSIEYFEEAMNNKNLTSMFNLAMIYIEIEEKKDLKKAKKYLTHLVDCGYSLASYTLISMFFNQEKTLTHNKTNDNISQSEDTIPETFPVESEFDKQIKSIPTIDIHNEKMILADNYYTGINGECDYAKAFEIYRELADLGSINAQIKVATMYKDGIGTEKDSSKSLEWYIKTIKSCQPESVNNNSLN